jgi:hypothetical protein
LYAGGDFTKAGEVDANRIAKWDGSQWSPLGSGMNGQVRALLAVGDELIAGGDFTTAGGVSAKYLAKWDGSQWTEFGGGMDNWVRSLALINGEMYAGGSFTKAGNDSVNRLAKWTGTHWVGFGSGMTPSQWGNPIVQTIVPLEDDIYCGGTFEVAGGKPSSFISRWMKWGVGIQEPVSTDEEPSQLSIYPNPSSGTITLNSAIFRKQPAILQITTPQGKLVLEKMIPAGAEEFSLDIKSFPPGVYSVSVNSNNQCIVKKLIKL